MIASPGQGTHARTGADARRWRLPDRSTRVLLLMLVIVALSAADLAMTLIHARAVGMIEANPVARVIMSAGSSGPIIAWKLVTAGVACAILAAIRHHRCAEIGALLCAGVLAWLTTHWFHYNASAHELTPRLDEVRAHEESRWVALTPTADAQTRP